MNDKVAFLIGLPAVSSKRPDTIAHGINLTVIGSFSSPRITMLPASFFSSWAKHTSRGRRLSKPRMVNSAVCSAGLTSPDQSSRRPMARRDKGCAVRPHKLALNDLSFT